MNDFAQRAHDLVTKARELHATERRLSVQSMLVVGELDRLRVAAVRGMSTEAFAKSIGLTPHQFWKRCQAARVARRYPAAMTMLEGGETSVSHLAMLAGKLTDANSEILLSGIKGKTRREVEALLSRVSADGRLLECQGEVELRLRLTGAQLATLDRAREVLSARGHVPCLADIVTAALGDLLERRDPLRKAARAEARAKRREGQEGAGPATRQEETTVLQGKRREDQEAAAPAARQEETAVAKALLALDLRHPQAAAVDEVMAAPAARQGEEGTSTSGGAAPAVPAARQEGRARTTRRPTIPAAIKHAVWLRDQGQCTWRFADESRCGEKAMVELDHQTMWCRGGAHSLENLTLRCKFHNRLAAERELGAAFMATWSREGLADAERR